MRESYQSYSEIPPLVQDYVLTIAGKKHIMSIPLDEINLFLDGLTEYYKNKEEEHEEGWVL